MSAREADKALIRTLCSPSWLQAGSVKNANVLPHSYGVLTVWRFRSSVKGSFSLAAFVTGSTVRNAHFRRLVETLRLKKPKFLSS
jgi:hypothetical protein